MLVVISQGLYSIDILPILTLMSVYSIRYNLAQQLVLLLQFGEEAKLCFCPHQVMAGVSNFKISIALQMIRKETHALHIGQQHHPQKQRFNFFIG